MSKEDILKRFVDLDKRVLLLAEELHSFVYTVEVLSGVVLAFIGYMIYLLIHIHKESQKNQIETNKRLEESIKESKEAQRILNEKMSESIFLLTGIVNRNNLQ